MQAELEKLRKRSNGTQVTGYSEQWEIEGIEAHMGRINLAKNNDNKAEVSIEEGEIVEDAMNLD